MNLLFAVILYCFVSEVQHDAQHARLGDMAVFENRQPVTAVKFINKSLLFIPCMLQDLIATLKHNLIY